MDLRWQHYKEWLLDEEILIGKKVLAIPLPSQICTDSRTLKENQWFFPIIGKKYDGHQYINEALRKKAQGFFYQKDSKYSFDKEKGIALDGNIDSLQKIARGWRTFLNPIVIAITGSVGKTTCKEILYSILSEHDKTLATSANLNNEIGVALTLLMLEPENKFAIIEMGARHKNDIFELVNIALPNISICLAITNNHLETFGSKQALVYAKTDIFRSSPKNTLCIGNADDPEIMSYLINESRKIKTFGMTADADYKMIDFTANDECLHLNTNKSPQSLKIPSLNQGILPNTMAAIACAIEQKISLDTIQNGLMKYEDKPGRFYVHKKENTLVVDDSYNASPESFAMGFKSLKQISKGKKLLVVIGDMKELGKQSDLFHENVGSMLFDLNPSFTYLVGKKAAHYLKGAVSSGCKEHQFEKFACVKELYTYTKRDLKNFDLIYVKGSRSVHLDLYVDALVTIKKGQPLSCLEN